MSAIQITITDAGRAEIINAANTGTGPVEITEVGLGTGKYAPDPTQTGLVSEIKRLSTIAGQVVSDDTIHVTVKDEGADEYDVSEFGLYTDSGTLFAVYSQASGNFMQKASQSSLLLSVDVVLETLAATSLTFGDTSFSLPPASETVKGVVEIATPIEAADGADNTRAVTSAGVLAALQRYGVGATASNLGPVTLQTDPLSVPNGWYTVSGADIESPEGPTSGYVEHIRGSISARQRFMSASTSNTYKRIFQSGEWRSWEKELASTDLTQSESDTTDGRILKVGDFGLPKTENYFALPAAIGGTDAETDWNTIVEPGWWQKVLSNNQNGPGGGGTGYWYCLVAAYANTGNVTQIAVPYGVTNNPGTIKWRARYNGAWTDWREVYSTGNTPAFLAQNGYQKLPNGLIFQWGVVEAVSHASNVPVTFPVTFPNTCFMVVASQYQGEAGSTPVDNQAQVNSVSKTSFSLYSNDTNSLDGTMSFAWIAVGH